MGSVRHGAQRASGRTSQVTPVTFAAATSGSSSGLVAERPTTVGQHARPGTIVPPRRRPARPGQRWLVVLVLTLTAVSGSVGPTTPTATAAADYILMPRSELLSLPLSGTAWSGLKTVADAALGTPDLCNQDTKHHLRTLAAALVYARTGIASYATKAQAGVMAAIGTQVVGCNNATLALGRQLTAYVLAANLAGLSGTPDATFRTWLSAIRTKNIGGHSTWYSLTRTHMLAPNNWGAHAGAARIAADLYLGDSADLAAAAAVTQGFLGNRSAYAGFTDNLTSAAVSWTCSGSVATYTPENPACTKNGINIDGGIAADISRGGTLRWPPADPGIPYQLESIQGVGLQVELLYRNGYPGAWTWSNSALRRAAAIVTRSAASGGTGWNQTTASRQMPWLLNQRYGTSIPTQTSGMGRSIGFTDWLYGGGSAPTGGGGGGGGGGSTPTAVAAPTITAPRVLLGSAIVPLSGVPSIVRWSLASSSAGLKRYDLQRSIDGGSYVGLALASATTAFRRVILALGHHYTFRARAVDLSGRIGSWKTVGPTRGAAVSDASASVVYRGTWRIASSLLYLRGRVHYTRSARATATLHYGGASVAWVGPKGPGRGKSRVYLDGTLVATVDQYARSFSARRVLFARNVPAGVHTLVIRALGTAGRPMVAIDAIYVLVPG